MTTIQESKIVQSIADYIDLSEPYLVVNLELPGMQADHLVVTCLPPVGSTIDIDSQMYIVTAIRFELIGNAHRPILTLVFAP